MTHPLRTLFCAASVLIAHQGAARAAQSEVRACLPLADGALALATSRGLVLLGRDGGRDGQPPRLLTALNGLPETRVHVMEVASSPSELWVGTAAGLARVHVTSEGMRVRAVYPSAPVRALLAWKGELLVGTWGDGLQRLTRDGRLVPVLTKGQAGAERITALAALGRAVIVATAGAGLFTLEDQELRPRSVELPSSLVWSLAVVGEQLYAGTVQGLVEIGPQGSSTLTTADVRALALASGRLLVATYGEGLQETALPRPRLVRSGPPRAMFVHAIGQSRTGASCLAAREGLWIRAPRSTSWVEVALQAGPPSADLSALAHDGERLWVGTYDEGLAALHAGQWAIVGSDVLDRRVNALLVEGSGPSRVLWIATARGLFALRGAAGRPKIRRYSRLDGLPSDDVLALARTRRGLLIGTARGAALLHDGRLTILGRKQGLIISAVWAVAASEDGLLWLGTSKGLFSGRPGERWRRFSISSGHLRDDWVTALRYDHGLLTVGTYNGGLTQLNIDEAHNVTATPLAPGWVNFGGLSVARDQLYAATMDGLLVCALAQPTSCKLRSALAPGRDVTAALEAEGRLWVASRRGLAAVALP